MVVIAGETGSGKTTQIPKMCLEAGLGIEAKIGCTQPRRVAALSISRRIAEELNVDWGREVGCKIRFDDRSSAHTYIKLMTDGILLAETQGDHLLSEYNAIIIDEAHERSLNIDFLLGYLKSLLARRPDLKLIITSATIDTQRFRSLRQRADHRSLRTAVPVEVVYSPSTPSPRRAATSATSMPRCRRRSACFVNPAMATCSSSCRANATSAKRATSSKAGSARRKSSLSLAGSGSGDQQRVFAPSARRKIVIATNIAETSLTIPGIRYVIDAGLARISRYNPRTRTKRLPIEPISQSSANQRKGRGGRVRNGICIRLYSEEDFAARPPFTQPEIQRANLAEVILRMKAFHLGDIETFPFLNPPTPAAIQAGYSLLQELGALDEARELTARENTRAAADRSDARPHAAPIAARTRHPELLIIAAGLSIQDPRERPPNKKTPPPPRTSASPIRDPISSRCSTSGTPFTTSGRSSARKISVANSAKPTFFPTCACANGRILFAQLHDALEDLGTLKLNESNAAYDAIHRSILAGLIGHVATRGTQPLQSRRQSQAGSAFPGSALFERSDPPKKAAQR